ncbi:MAG: hypothetical protein IPM52_10530 [Bacteroidetes bacterium]|nr:hypothetical protein [Bacteroidota bacterium]
MNKPMPEIGFVLYGATPAQLGKLRAWARRLGAGRVLFVENKAGHAVGDVVQGDNRYSEFSAYIQLCRLFVGPGPFIIVNDTLLRTHWTWGWREIMRKALHAGLPQGAITGDIRHDRDHVAGKPATYLASWIFGIAGRSELIAFEHALTQAVQHSDSLPEAYQNWLDRWLNPGRFSGGWHRKATEAERQRKRFCVITEHRLSQLLPGYGLDLVSIGTFSPIRYRMIRIADRLRTRAAAIREHIRSRAF